MNQFNYYSKSILMGMNSVERLVPGKMFHQVLPEFERNFWMAHDSKNIREMMKLNEILNKIIDDLNAGNSFVLDRAK